MLSKKNRLKNKKDFDRVFKGGKGYKSDFLFLKFKENKLKHSRFGIVLGKKISNKAVVRNKIKRRLREIIKKKINKTKEGLDIILIARSGIEKQKTDKLEEIVEKLLKKSGTMQ